MDYRDAGVDIAAADAGQGPRIKGLGAGDLQPLRAHRDRLLRRDVPPGPRPLPRARPRGLHRRCRHEDPRRHSLPASTTRSATTSWPTASTTSSSRARCPSSSSTTSPSGRMDPAQGRADRLRLLAGLRGVRLPADRRRDRRDAGHLRGGRLRPRRASSWASSTGRGPAARRAARATSSSGCPRRACTPTATRSPARSCLEVLGHSVDTAPPRARHDRRQGAAGPAPRLPRCRRAAARARHGAGAWPTSPAAASRATSRACCRTGLGVAHPARLLADVLPIFRLIQADGGGSDERDVPDLQHGRSA